MKRPLTSEIVIACTSRSRYFDLDAIRQPSVNPLGVGVRPTMARVNGSDDHDARGTLDPFAGSGTTLAVATGHGRDAIGIDLDPRNHDLARERIGMFLELAEPGMAIIPTGDYL